MYLIVSLIVILTYSYFLTVLRKKIRLIESNALSKKITCIGDFAAGVYLSEAPTPPRFLFLVWLSNI